MAFVTRWPARTPRWPGVSANDRLRGTGRGHVLPRHRPAGPAAAVRQAWQLPAPFRSRRNRRAGGERLVRAGESVQPVLIFAAATLARRPTDPRCCAPRSVSVTASLQGHHSVTDRPLWAGRETLVRYFELLCGPSRVISCWIIERAFAPTLTVRRCCRRSRQYRVLGSNKVVHGRSREIDSDLPARSLR